MSQTTTTAAAGTGICERPIESSIHCHVRSGVRSRRASATDTTSSTSSRLQNVTAGPSRGPPTKSTQRASDRPILVVALTLGAPRSIAGA